MIPRSGSEDSEIGKGVIKIMYGSELFLQTPLW